MRPLNTQVLRRERRREWRGFPSGRRATHAVVTAYGRHQRDRASREAFSAFCAQLRATGAGDDGG